MRTWWPYGRAVGWLLLGTMLGTSWLVLDVCTWTLATALHELTAGRSLPFETLLTAAAAGAFAGCGVWIGLVTVATTVECLTGLSSAAVRAMSPGIVRRVVLVCCGVAVGGAGVVAPATGSMPEGGREPQAMGAAALVTGLPVPDRTTGALVPEQPVMSAVTRPLMLSETPTRRVGAGDSLWSVAANLLGDHRGPAAVSSAWRALYRENRTTVGPDPDLIYPGTVLRVPPSLWRDVPGNHHADSPSPQRKDAP